MSDDVYIDPQLERFETNRPRLFGIAYRMLGSAVDADDVLQEAFLRWSKAGANAQSPEALLTTIVTRLAIDALTSARARRETYIGPWLPEPILTSPDNAVAHSEMTDSISLAFLALLERLSAEERAVLLLREVFDYSYPEIASFLDKGAAACRQLFSRAKRHIREHRPRLAPSAEAHQRIFRAFLDALQSGDTDALLGLLHDDIRVIGDGGGQATAARNIVTGKDLVARMLLGLRKLLPGGAIHELAPVNGQLSLVTRSADGRVYSVMAIETDGAVIYAVRSVVNPQKLRGVM